jgi:hypothetical protein
MPSGTYAYIVCSPRGRVGVTMTARLLADYFLQGNRPFVGFDTDPHESNFAERFPREAMVVDLSAVKGQISLFDRLLVNDGTPKVVDLWSRSWKTFFTMVRDIGFFEEALRLGVEPIVVLVVDESTECLDAANGLIAQWPDLTLVLARNEGAAPGLEGAGDILARYSTTRSFEIQALDPIVAQAIERRGVSLSRFLLAPPTDMSIVIKTAARTWLTRVFAQFQSFELRQAMRDWRSSG